MSEAERTISASDDRQGAARRRLDQLVARARAAGLWERAWPVLWRGLGVVLAFLAVSWLGVWLDLSPLWRIVGLGLFALLFVAALLPALRLRPLSRREALARIDREATRQGGSAHDPASSIEDTLAVGQSDPVTRALWALHQSRAAAAVARLKAGRPRPHMPGHDPLALRAGVLVAALAALFVAGPEWRGRVAAAFDWRAPQAAAPSFRVDGWIDPPIYTRVPPLIVTMSGAAKDAVQRLRAPVNSTLIVRIAGQGEAELTPNAALVPIPKDEKAASSRPALQSGAQASETRTSLREERFRLAGGTAELGIAASGSEPQRLVIETIPDHAPEVSRVGDLEVNGRGTFNLTYRAKDDYGIASAEGLIEPLKAGRSLVPVPKIGLALPTDATGETETKTLVDLTDNPWSGARVKLTLVVRDEAGQEGRTESAEIVLPARPFTQPLARALAEERRRLVTAPDEDRARVQTALDALRIAPERFTPQPGIFLGLTTAANRLRAAKSDEDLTGVADLLWEMALKIEDGDLSDAEKALRAAQDRLKEAIERNAPDEEIKKLTEDLKQALDKFMKEFAQRAKPQNRQQAERQQQQQNSQTVTPDDLEKMIKDMQEAMQRGDTAEAQRLLEQLRNVLENLQNAEGGQKSDGGMAEMNRQLDELDKMSREQQELRDETYKEGQQGQQRSGQRQRPQPGQQQGQRGQQPGQQGEGQQGQRGQGQQGQQGQGQQGQGGGQQGQSMGQRQQGLREQLQDLKNRMKQQGLQGEEGLADAEEAMREAEEALGRGRSGDAVDAQGRALDGLKRGAEGMQKQMQQMAEGEGQGEGQKDGQSQSQQGRSGSGDDDPLGRPTRGRDLSNGNVRVPNADESAVQRARRIMEELRRKLGDPSRPQEELDYFERLLRRN
ncbi:TIGR02302 family protein [Methylobacterium sp. NI91]|nr:MULTISPECIES: TIGR02302 family protein [unclassified Methylobacterium]QIJ74511.1 TIGR02302 family protein [Methylobacterium sp. CLZ]QIJ79417.1 TIGR02302 family protein [Methylobacterium sp. NI91]